MLWQRKCFCARIPGVSLGVPPQDSHWQVYKTLSKTHIPVILTGVFPWGGPGGFWQCSHNPPRGLWHDVLQECFLMWFRHKLYKYAPYYEEILTEKWVGMTRIFLSIIGSVRISWVYLRGGSLEICITWCITATHLCVSCIYINNHNKTRNLPVLFSMVNNCKEY